MPQPTTRAIAISIEDQVSGIIGIAREAWSARYFSEYKPELEPYLNSVLIMRAVIASLKFVQQYPCPVFSRASHDEGGRILQRLGFVPTNNEGVFVWLK